jgi:hypothetical protein
MHDSETESRLLIRKRHNVLGNVKEGRYFQPEIKGSLGELQETLVDSAVQTKILLCACWDKCPFARTARSKINESVLSFPGELQNQGPDHAR